MGVVKSCCCFASYVSVECFTFKIIVLSSTLIFLQKYSQITLSSILYFTGYLSIPYFLRFPQYYFSNLIIAFRLFLGGLPMIFGKKYRIYVGGIGGGFSDRFLVSVNWDSSTVCLDFCWGCIGIS